VHSTDYCRPTRLNVVTVTATRNIDAAADNHPTLSRALTAPSAFDFAIDKVGSR